mmetsp:Transcript_80370/g.260503  ORF Transcript_80370/g.260503 Transcript_80370/m.260503 type:complete len:80 (+) Transcript_80370:682-921(+)
MRRSFSHTLRTSSMVALRDGRGCGSACELCPVRVVPWQGSAASSASLGAPSERRSQLRCEARGEFRGILRFRLPVRLEA